MLSLDPDAPFIFADCHEGWIQSTRGEKFDSRSACILPVAVKIDAGVMRQKIVCENVNQVCRCSPDILTYGTEDSQSTISKKKSYDYNMLG